MARTVKPEAFAAKRKEILDAAQRLVFTKGYEQMSIQDILDEIQFPVELHHYFNSRGALLEAIVERIKLETEKSLLPIIHDPHLTAIEKFQGFFDTLDRLRSAIKADLLKLARVWYTDHNAVVRLKVDEAVQEQRVPMLAEIIRQGVREGVFNTPYPDRAGEVVHSLLQSMGNTHARLLLSLEQGHDDLHCIEQIITTHAAYLDALERVLGAPSLSFIRADVEAVNGWAAAVRGTDHA